MGQRTARWPRCRSLLVKLGELPPPGGSSRTVRMIDASATPETYEYLQRLRQQWNRLSPNPLELPDAGSVPGSQ